MIVGGWNNSRNVKHPFPRVADKECLRKLLIEIPRTKPSCVSGSWSELRPLLLKRLPLRVGAVTDCFQRYMESKTRTGLELLRVLKEAKYPAQIVTKSDLIAENEYIEAMKGNEENLVIQLSITTLDDQVSRRLESGAPTSSKRIEALSRLVKEGFITAVRINPLFPIYPDETLENLSSSSGLDGTALFQSAKQLSVPTLPIFDLALVENINKVFNCAPESTIGKHTLIAGFVRLPFATVKWVSEALGWDTDRLKGFFKVTKGNCYYYSTTEIRHYYEAIRELCCTDKVPFSVCYDADDNYEVFRNMWNNPRDCCNVLGNVSGFKKVYRDCCLPKTS